jgi:hypothetical protein
MPRDGFGQGVVVGQIGHPDAVEYILIRRQAVMRDIARLHAMGKDRAALRTAERWHRKPHPHCRGSNHCLAAGQPDAATWMRSS